MPWIRIDSARMQHPRMRRAGPWGAVVIEAAWEIARTFDGRGGTLSADQWTPEYLCFWTMFDRLEGGAEWMRQGMDAAQAAGLVAPDGDRFAIRDWRAYQWDSTNAERQKRFRNKDVDESNALRNAVTATKPNQTKPNQEKNNRKVNCAEPGAPDKPPRGALPVDHFAWQLVDAFHAAQGSTPRRREQEAQALDKLHRLDGVPLDELRAVLAWIPTDNKPAPGGWPGWASVVRSLASLRVVRADEPKWAKVRAAWLRAKSGGNGAAAQTRYPSRPAAMVRCESCGHLTYGSDAACNHCGEARAHG